MSNKLKRIFNPTYDERIEDYEEYKRLHEQFAKDRGCATCLHYIHIMYLPRLEPEDENGCMFGLKCDTKKVRNCPKWEDYFNDKKKAEWEEWVSKGKRSDDKSTDDMPDLPQFKVFFAKSGKEAETRFCITGDGWLCRFERGTTKATVVPKLGNLIIEIGKERYRW